MKKGQKIRLKASARAARDWGVPTGSEGVVLCEYRLVTRAAPPKECVDVQFGSGAIIWGAPSAVFEEISEGAQGRGA